MKATLNKEDKNTLRISSDFDSLVRIEVLYRAKAKASGEAIHHGFLQAGGKFIIVKGACGGGTGFNSLHHYNWFEPLEIGETITLEQTKRR